MRLRNSRLIVPKFLTRGFSKNSENRSWFISEGRSKNPLGGNRFFGLGALGLSAEKRFFNRRRPIRANTHNLGSALTLFHLGDEGYVLGRSNHHIGQLAHLCELAGAPLRDSGRVPPSVRECPLQCAWR